MVVVVGVEQIVLAVVLVVDDGLDLLQAVLEQPLRGLPAGAGAVGVAAPGEVGLGEVRGLLPAALVDERLQAGAVGTEIGRASCRGRVCQSVSIMGCLVLIKK